MPLRLIEIVVAEKDGDILAGLLAEERQVVMWNGSALQAGEDAGEEDGDGEDDGTNADGTNDGEDDGKAAAGGEVDRESARSRRIAQIALPAERVEEILDRLEERFGDDEGFRVALLPLEALLPRPVVDEDEDDDSGDDEGIEGGYPDGGDSGRPNDDEDDAEAVESGRISREELRAELVDDVSPGPAFLGLSALSAVVASVGLLDDSTAVVIGAMVIAPLLRPNLALALGLTLGDFHFARRALVTNGAGLLVALVPAVLAGLFLDIAPGISSLADRSELGVGDAVVALAAGAAASLAFLRGSAGPVIGVMVAVALVPPLVAFGLLMGAGAWGDAFGALVLTVANVLSINLAAIVLFLLHGLGPRAWSEAEKARRASLVTVAVWVGLLAFLLGLYWLFR